MKPGERLALAIVLGFVLLVGGTTGAAAYAWHRGGSVRIAIHESGPAGSDVSLSVPGVLVNTAIALCPVPDDAQLNTRLREISPALGEVASRLATLPDAVLVDIKSEDETLQVEKLGSELLIRVNAPNERVEVAVPIASVRKLMEKLAA
jgi:hypothetical protein